MTCPRCGGSSVNVSVVQESAVSNTKKKGCLFGLFRLLLIVCTCGLWLIFGKKKSKTKTTFSNKKVAVCQTCGHSWDM